MSSAALVGGRPRVRPRCRRCPPPPPAAATALPPPPPPPASPVPPLSIAARRTSRMRGRVKHLPRQWGNRRGAVFGGRPRQKLPKA